MFLFSCFEPLGIRLAKESRRHRTMTVRDLVDYVGIPIWNVPSAVLGHSRIGHTERRSLLVIAHKGVLALFT